MIQGRRSRLIVQTSLSVLALGVLSLSPRVWAEATPTPGKAKSLVELSKKNRKDRDQNRDKGHSKSFVITNEVVADNHDKGHMTTVSETPTPATPATQTPDESDKERWQKRYRTHLELMRELSNEIEHLDKAIPSLWRAYYSEDDVETRDRKIKPNLDAALVRRRDLEKRLQAEKKKGTELKREARRAGALPGWFREIDSEMD